MKTFVPVTCFHHNYVLEHSFQVKNIPLPYQELDTLAFYQYSYSSFFRSQSRRPTGLDCNKSSFKRARERDIAIRARQVMRVRKHASFAAEVTWGRFFAPLWCTGELPIKYLGTFYSQIAS